MTNESVALRGHFKGVARIVQFNWPQYAVGGVCLAAAATLLYSLPLPAWLVLLVILGIILAAWWLLASLVVSWWIYDLSPLMRLTWLTDILAHFHSNPHRILNVHAGYDDTSKTLAQLFSSEKLTLLDLFDAKCITEPSIHRSRRLYPSFPNTISGKWNAWPLESQSFDLVLFLMSAHEFRMATEREGLFAEARRVLAPHGKIVVAEHERNGWNFAAFGPGFLHFWPRGEWLRLASVTKLSVVHEGRITPFVGYFILEN